MQLLPFNSCSVDFISWKNEFPQSAPLLLDILKQVVFLLLSGRDSQAKRAGKMSKKEERSDSFTLRTHQKNQI